MPPSALRWLAPVVVFLLPLGLMGGLATSRPDLMGALLRGPPGALFMGGVALLAAGGGGAVAVSTTMLKEALGLRVGLGVAGVLLCTLPAVFVVLFGPVAFAFLSQE